VGAPNKEFALAGSLEELKGEGRLVVHGAHRPRRQRPFSMPHGALSKAEGTEGTGSPSGDKRLSESSSQEPMLPMAFIAGPFSRRTGHLLDRLVRHRRLVRRSAHRSW
jgi:hypothetical protein